MPSTTGLVYHDTFLDHDTGPGHPERPDRLLAITSHLKGIGMWHKLQHLTIQEAPEEWVLRVHTKRHLAFVREACRKGAAVLDQGDTHVCPGSYGVAMLAAGGVLAGVDAVMQGRTHQVFCAVRPPGHHAGGESVMGFCLFNNVAMAARYAQAAHHAERVAILDWDVHHGNGTQDIFYADDTVFYLSTHQYPFYPGTGSRSERGSGDGLAYTLNIPMGAGSGEKEYVEAFTEEILPALDTFHPDLVIISAGFDAHKDDPLANIELTEGSFGRLTQLVRESAERNCGGRILSVLEGGYNLTALARSVEAHLNVFLR